MILELLKEIGLSDKEATMYMTLLRNGLQPISVLARHAKLNRGTAYVILHALLSKGLVVQTTKQKIQYFSPLEPRQLLRYLEHKDQELHRQHERVEGMLGELIAITNPHTAQPKIQFYDGVEGARAVLDDTLTATGKTLQAFLSIADIGDFVGADFFNDYTTRRVQAGYSLQAIRTLEKDREALSRDTYAKRYTTNARERREVRYVSDDLAFPLTMYLYDQKLAIISSKRENFALLIQSTELVQMQKKLFSLLWNSVPSKKTKKSKKFD